MEMTKANYAAMSGTWEPETSKIAEVQNALVEQADLIASKINLAGDGDELAEALANFTEFVNLWKALGYGYKIAEVEQRIRARAEKIVQEEGEFLAGERKNSRVYRSTEANIRVCRNIIAKLS